MRLKFKNGSSLKFYNKKPKNFWFLLRFGKEGVFQYKTLSSTRYQARQWIKWYKNNDPTGYKIGPKLKIVKVEIVEIKDSNNAA